LDVGIQNIQIEFYFFFEEDGGYSCGELVLVERVDVESLTAAMDGRDDFVGIVTIMRYKAICNIPVYITSTNNVTNPYDSPNPNKRNDDLKPSPLWSTT